MKFEDFKSLGSELSVKASKALLCVEGALFWQAAGKYRQEGKGYEVEDGDIMFFKFNVAPAPKKK